MNQPAPVSREDQRKHTRRRIVDAARSLFYARGATLVSMEEIARGAQVGRATLYLHFPNKESILLELIAQNLAGVKRIFADLCDLPRLDLRAVQRWLKTYIEALRSHREAARLIQSGIGVLEEAGALVHAHHLALADMLAERFGLVDEGTARMQTRLMLAIGRIDAFASAAAAKPPRIDVEVGLDLVGRELLSLIQSQSGPPQR
jgi:AcrR family transcriptional regulator